ncbi:MAG TPA: hypothetical protein VGJ07_08510 [Rugosimonospora sp.]|jgi:hypothetical protein
MGFMRWLRGGDENSAATSAVSAGLAEIDGLFRPSKHKQTEHIQESKRKRVDVAASGIDLERGVAVIPSKEGVEDSDAEAGLASRREITRTVWKPRPQPWWSRLSPSARRRRRRQRAKSDSTQAQGAEPQGAESQNAEPQRAA